MVKYFAVSCMPAHDDLHDVRGTWPWRRARKKAHLEHSHGMHKRIQKLEEENQRLKKRLDAFDKYDQKKTS